MLYCPSRPRLGASFCLSSQQIPDVSVSPFALSWSAELKGLTGHPGFAFIAMTKVPLNHGQFALIDDEDADRVLVYFWTYYWSEKHKKATAHRTLWNKGKPTTVLLHRFVMNAPKGVQVDHIDRDGLNCQKSNLRFATNAQNHCNTIKKAGSTSRFKGVHFERRRQYYVANITVNRVAIHLGSFAKEEDAARAYDAKARELHGEFARLNFPNADERSALRTSSDGQAPKNLLPRQPNRGRRVNGGQCKVPTCNKRAKCRGICPMHYCRVKKYGDVEGHHPKMHFHSRAGRWTPEYNAWVHMIQRCTNPNNKQWLNYGGRGIRVCDLWRLSYRAFYEHVGSRPSPLHSLDRIDNDGNYEPGNVRWATAQEQGLNRRRNPYYDRNRSVNP